MRSIQACTRASPRYRALHARCHLRADRGEPGQTRIRDARRMHPQVSRAEMAQQNRQLTVLACGLSRALLRRWLHSVQVNRLEAPYQVPPGWHGGCHGGVPDTSDLQARDAGLPRPPPQETARLCDARECREGGEVAGTGGARSVCRSIEVASKRLPPLMTGADGFGNGMPHVQGWSADRGRDRRGAAGDPLENRL